jgi:hypothetical protein
VLAVTAVVALWVAWRQIGISRELAALEAYENYHSMCLRYPQFTTGEVDFRNFNRQEKEQYKIFVLYTLMMDERIYTLFPRDRGWRFSIKDDIRTHKRFISSEEFAQDLSSQGWSFTSLIDEVLAEDS